MPHGYTRKVREMPHLFLWHWFLTLCRICWYLYCILYFPIVSRISLHLNAKTPQQLRPYPLVGPLHLNASWLKIHLLLYGIELSTHCRKLRAYNYFSGKSWGSLYQLLFDCMFILGIRCSNPSLNNNQKLRFHIAIMKFFIIRKLGYVLL